MCVEPDQQTVALSLGASLTVCVCVCVCVVLKSLSKDIIMVTISHMLADQRTNWPVVSGDPKSPPLQLTSAATVSQESREKHLR